MSITEGVAIRIDYTLCPHEMNKDQKLHTLSSAGSYSADAIPQHDGQNQMTSEDGLAQHDEDNLMANEADVTNHPIEQMQMTSEGIDEGKTRPTVPLIAAKFATECNIIVRNHILVLTHWKEYKKQPTIFTQFMMRIQTKFDVDANDLAIKKGCLEMMTYAVRQQCHKLKKKYFDPFQLHLCWDQISKVGAYTCGFQGDKFKDQGPNAFDLFKLCHYSKKNKGYTPTLHMAIVEDQY
uniref:Uncharacterized protein n=1 Tax=Oryza brachyantha TaxID=4533 RepID=J3ME77_ORYBR